MLIQSGLSCPGVSLSSRERGSKLEAMPEELRIRLVALLAGAWIETATACPCWRVRRVALLAGAWIETRSHATVTSPLSSLSSRERGSKHGLQEAGRRAGPCRSPRGSVDRNGGLVKRRKKPKSRSPRGSVDRNPAWLETNSDRGVALLAGAWIETRLLRSAGTAAFGVALLAGAWIETYKSRSR